MQGKTIKRIGIALMSIPAIAVGSVLAFALAQNPHWLYILVLVGLWVAGGLLVQIGREK